MNIIQEYISSFRETVERVKKEVSALRTGRASPAIVEDVPVEAYGGKQPLKTVASIIVTDPKTLTVEVWDKSIMGAVERAIRDADIGINPVNDGKVIRLPLPSLTAERRQELIKILRQKLEAGRIALRQAREETKEMIDAAEKDKDIGEDEKFRQYEALDKLMKEMNEHIRVIGEEKEKEILTV